MARRRDGSALPDYDEAQNVLYELGVHHLINVAPQSKEYWQSEECIADHFSIRPFAGNAPNAWFLASCYLHHDTDHAFQYLSDTTLDNNEINSAFLIWQQHRRIIARLHRQGCKAYEILKHIPLDHFSWPAEAKIYFEQHQCHNVYQALPIITIDNIETAQHCRLLIQQYIQEIKSLDT